MRKFDELPDDLIVLGAEGEEATAGEGGSERSESGHRASFEELSPPQG